MISELTRKISKQILQFRQNIDGHIAVTTAMIGLPLILIAGYAVDFNKALSGRSEIGSAIDAAALASVLPANLTIDERKDLAQKVFDENYFGNLTVELSIEASRERVDIAATGHSPSLFGGVVGKDTMQVTDKTAAVLTVADVVCVLALDPDGESAIEFKGNTKFNAPACSVQANSTSNLSIDSQSLYVPRAKNFCTSGVSRGKFDPSIKHACTPIADPYADVPLPPSGPCMPIDKINSVDAFDPVTGVIETIVGTGAVLYPGTYCNGMKIEGVNITFMPGIYHFKDRSLKITEGAEVKGDDVTIAFSGEISRIKIESGASVDFTAPSTGTYAGIVLFQPAEGYPYKNKNNKKKPYGVNKIGSGGGLKITGTAYFPVHSLEVFSDSNVVSQAPATSFIAYQVSFSGDSNVTVNVDHEKGGVPPIQPRSDEGARLVR